MEKFEQSMQGGGLLGYIDALSGGSISKVGVFSLGALPCTCALPYRASAWTDSALCILTLRYHDLFHVHLFCDFCLQMVCQLTASTPPLDCH